MGFDLDYTLAVPDRDRETLLAEAVEAAGGPPLDGWTSREAYREAHRRNLTDETRVPVFEDLLRETDVDVDPAVLADAYRERVNDALVPVPGVEDMLRGLRDRYRVGLLTNGPAVSQRSKLGVLAWEDTFDAVLVSGDLEAGKPDPRAFEALLDALSIPAEATVFVGDDADADVAGAKDAGLRAVQVLVPDGPAPHPAADAVLERDDLPAALPVVLESL